MTWSLDWAILVMFTPQGTVSNSEQQKHRWCTLSSNLVSLSSTHAHVGFGTLFSLRFIVSGVGVLYNSSDCWDFTVIALDYCTPCSFSHCNLSSVEQWPSLGLVCGLVLSSRRQWITDLKMILTLRWLTTLALLFVSLLVTGCVFMCSDIVSVL